MDSESLLVGRPFGGCSILYRKSLLSSVSPVVTCSSRFYTVKIVASNAISYLAVCVCMPGYINSSSHLDYLNTIGVARFSWCSELWCVVNRWWLQSWFWLTWSTCFFDTWFVLPECSGFHLHIWAWWWLMSVLDWSCSLLSRVCLYDLLLEKFAPFQSCVAVCLSARCSCHYDYLDGYAKHLVTTILSCASHCTPSRHSTNHR